MFFVMVLPIAEIVLRQTPLGGLKATATLVQHFTLVIGMLGGALAARNGRLLSLATAENFLSGRLRMTGLILINSMNAVVAFFLCTASVAFVQAEFAGGNEFAYGIPFWVVQLILPIGFGLVALHCLIRSGENWRSRLVALGLVAAVVALIWKSPVEPEHLFLPLLILLFVVTALGGAIFAVIGGVALLLFWRDFFPVAVVPLKHYSLVTNPMLPTIPLFTLAGYFLAEGGASRRLVAVFRCLFGNLRGGPAIVAIVVSAFFTTFTGASGVTILALGGILMPVLLESRYQERHALGLITGSSSLGVLFPPCLPLILYAIIASTAVANLGGLSDTASAVSMEAMFAGALLPALLMLGLTCWLGVVESPKSLSVSGAFSWASSKIAVWEAKWELLLPMVALVAFFSGYCTPVEAAAITALYAFIVEAWVYRDLRPLRDGVRVMTECGLLVGGVLLILGVRSRLYPLPSGRAGTRSSSSMGHRHDPIPLALPACPQCLSLGRWLPDGHLFSHHRGRSADCAHRYRVRGRSNSPGGHFSSQPTTGISHATGGYEPISLLLSFRKAVAGGLPVGDSDVFRAPHRCSSDYLRGATIDHSAAPVRRMSIVTSVVSAYCFGSERTGRSGVEKVAVSRIALKIGNFGNWRCQ